MRLGLNIHVLGRVPEIIISGDKQMKKINAVFAILFVILVPIVLLLTNVQIVAFNRDYYRAEYTKYDIPGHIGMNMDELMDSTEKLLLYLDNKRENLDFEADFINGTEEFFSQRDKLHMIDVKGLFVKGRLIRNISLLYTAGFVLFLFRNKPVYRQMRKLARYGIFISAAGIAPVLVLMILMNIDFYKYFTVFHEIFFTNDLWLLDPAQDRLVNIFPQDFFTDMAFSISYLYVAEIILIFIGSLILLKYAKAKAN